MRSKLTRLTSVLPTSEGVLLQVSTGLAHQAAPSSTTAGRFCARPLPEMTIVPGARLSQERQNRRHSLTIKELNHETFHMDRVVPGPWPAAAC
jgi:hypothetical protein